MTDNEKEAVLRKIGEYVRERTGNGIQVWNPAPSMGSNTIGFSRYSICDINIRLTKTKYPQGQKQQFDVDIHLFIKEKNNVVRFNGLRQNFENEAEGLGHGIWCEWKKEKQALVDFHVPIRWDQWATIQEEDRKLVADAFLKFANVITSANIDLGRPTGAMRAATHRRIVNVKSFPGNNCIVFGAPGTGKSNLFEKYRQKKWSDVVVDVEDAKANEDYFKEYKRVTFYPTYSYAQFFGSYKPAMNGDKIVYRFVPGPFLKILVKALKDPDHNYLLIIEEINRANAAAVFGDVFQLLDRNDDGKGVYSIDVSDEAGDYLRSELKNRDNQEQEETAKGEALRLPSNFYIWATMNSADQGVFPLDTAFKRRWDFEYLPVDGSEQKGVIVEAGKCSLDWSELRKAINGLLSDNGVNEDKLLGGYFILPDSSFTSVAGNGAEEKEIAVNMITAECFKTKVLMYLWEDAARMCRHNVFGDKKTFSSLMDAWDKLKVDDDQEHSINIKAIFQFNGSDVPVCKPKPEEKKVNQGNADDQEAVANGQAPVPVENPHPDGNEPAVDAARQET